MRVNDPGKFLILVVAIIGAVVLLGLGRVSEAGGIGIITYALGYLSGNGRLARQGKRPEPTLSGTPPDQLHGVTADTTIRDLLEAPPPDDDADDVDEAAAP